jgi:hypothetical protein
MSTEHLPALASPPEQRDLFPELELPIVEAAKTKSFVHTGAFISRDEVLCREICMDLIAGISRRAIALRFGVSRNTVNAIREIMEARGELEPLKREVARRLDRCVIFGLENLEHALATDGLPASQLSVACGILLDKKAALEGQPTSRIEHITTRKPSHEELNAWIDALPAAQAPAALPETTDSASAGTASQPVEPETPAGGADE